MQNLDPYQKRVSISIFYNTSQFLDHGADCRTNLYSLPTTPIDRDLDLFLEACGLNKPDLIFLQLDPMHYITRQRYMSQKAALHGVEEYDKKAIENLNFPFPMTWEEAVVNLVVFDMLRANQVHMKLDYTKGVSTYAYPDLQDERTHDNLKDKFVQAITDYVICDSWSPYYEINQILFKALMGKHKVVLGDMPELLLRQIIGNSLSLEDVKDIFKFVLEQISKAKVPITMQTATLQYFSHIFLMPKDLYMTALLRNCMQASNCSLVFVGNPHFAPIQTYWQPPPHGINYTQATKIPKRIENDSNEMLIEKQAILDVLLDTRLWGEKYILNPFPYIEEDITKISESDLKSFKKHFYINLKKYQSFRDKIVAPEAYQMIDDLETKYERLGDVKMLPKI